MADERPTPFQAGLEALLQAHTPSLTQEAEAEIDEVLEAEPDGIGYAFDYADIAIRYCSCGTRIDGFYEYIDHLRDKAGLRGRLGSVPGVPSRDA